MHGPHLLTLGNAIFKFTVFELKFIKKKLTSEVEVRTSKFLCHLSEWTSS
jgi:hypothetical protein